MPNSTIERRAPRRLLGALMMALVAPTACGGGDGPAGGPDATSIDAVATDANTAPMTSAEITAARGTADGTGLSLPIT